MSALIRSRARICTIISRSSGRCASTYSAEPPKDQILSASSSLHADHIAPPPPESFPPQPKSSSFSFLKYGLLAAFTGAAATAGYATYAYSLEEVEKMTKDIRSPTKFTVKDDATLVDKFQGYVQDAAVAVPAKLVDAYIDLRRFTEEHVRGFTEPLSDKLLPDRHPNEQHIITLVLDLTETLIYSDWTRDRGWRTFKRPGVDAFLEHLAHYYEIVLYSDQLQMYVDPVMERLDPKHYFSYKLSRGATKYVDGKHFRDLSTLNRDPAKVLYISAHALESCLQPENSLAIKQWKGEADDTTLLDLIPFLEYLATQRTVDTRNVVAAYKGHDDIGKEFIKRHLETQKRISENKKNSIWKR